MYKTIAAALCVLAFAAGTGCGQASSQDGELRMVRPAFAETQQKLNGGNETQPAAVTAAQAAESETAAQPPASAAADETPIPAPAQKVSQEKKIMLNLASRLLTLYQGPVPIRMYPVGVGKVSTPTPVGHYAVSEKIVNPTWTDPDSGVSISSGPDCPLGYRWLGLFGNYGIHGTNHPESIGGYVSNGCVRMYEKDVEDLYDHVPVGTAVDIYYDRIVINRDNDHTISYYIYPDGYGWQALDAAKVKKALAGYGVEDFADNGAIAEKIAASDGQPTYVAKAYDLYVNGSKLKKRALGKNGQVWLPAFALASATHTDSEWSSAAQTMTTERGSAAGMVKSDVVYLNSEAAKKLYGLKGGLGQDLVYRLSSVSPAPASAAKSK